MWHFYRKRIRYLCSLTMLVLARQCSSWWNSISRGKNPSGFPDVPKLGPPARQSISVRPERGWLFSPKDTSMTRIAPTFLGAMHLDEICTLLVLLWGKVIRFVYVFWLCNINFPKWYAYQALNCLALGPTSPLFHTPHSPCHDSSACQSSVWIDHRPRCAQKPPCRCCDGAQDNHKLVSGNGSQIQ